MKKTSVFILLLLCNILLYAQGRSAVEINSKWEEDCLVFSAQNNDYCDYYVSMDLSLVSGFKNVISPYTTIITKGENRLFELKKNDSSIQSARYTFHHFRGNPDKKINIDFHYALPVKTGDTISCRPKKMIDYTLRFRLQDTGDTIYACRGGIVCNDDVYDTSRKGYSKLKNLITIAHDDGSFAEYSAFASSLVFAGEAVKMGDPIAISMQVDGSIASETDVSFFFLDKNKLALNTGKRHTHFIPFFHTAGNAAVRLEEETAYTSEITDEMLMQDMSARERKKFLSKKK